MNNSFSPSRFINLFKKHTAEHYKAYLLMLVLLAGLLAIVIGYASFVNNHALLGTNLQIALFSSFLLLAGAVFTSSMFSDLSDNKKAIATLTLPASHFEKLLVKWVYSYLLFQIIFVPVFYVLMWCVQKTVSNPTQRHTVINIFHEHDMALIFIAYMAINATTLFGSVFFRKLHFVKSFCAFMTGTMLLIMANKPILRHLTGRNDVWSFPFGEARYIEHNQIFEFDALGWHDTQFLYALAIMAIVFWAAAYYRVKEKQV